MSELQDSLLIAFLTGVFTLSGISIGALLEHWREKSNYDREKEKRQREMEDDSKRNYLSPLYFYLNKCLFLPALSSIGTFAELKKELINLEKLKGSTEAVEDLMKNNMHVLPKELNMSLGYYIGALRIFFNSVEEISQFTNEISGKEERTRVPKGFLEGLAKLESVFDDMTGSFLAPIYAFMKFNISPKQTTFEIGEKGREIHEALDAMKAGLLSELKKESKIDTK